MDATQTGWRAVYVLMSEVVRKDSTVGVEGVQCEPGDRTVNSSDVPQRMRQQNPAVSASMKPTSRHRRQEADAARSQGHTVRKRHTREKQADGGRRRMRLRRRGRYRGNTPTSAT